MNVDIFLCHNSNFCTDKEKSPPVQSFFSQNLVDYVQCVMLVSKIAIVYAPRSFLHACSYFTGISVNNSICVLRVNYAISGAEILPKDRCGCC